MAPLKSILVPVDFDAHCERILDFGRTIADAYGASLHLLHVLSDPMDDPDARAARLAEAETRLNAMLTEQGWRTGLTVSCEVGTPAPTIARYAADHDIDLIVMGTHSHGPTFQMACGSIAETVVGLSPCSVLAVKEKAPARGWEMDPVGAATNIP